MDLDFSILKFLKVLVFLDIDCQNNKLSLYMSVYIRLSESVALPHRFSSQLDI